MSSSFIVIIMNHESQQCASLYPHAIESFHGARRDRSAMKLSPRFGASLKRISPIRCSHRSSRESNVRANTNELNARATTDGTFAHVPTLTRIARAIALEGCAIIHDVTRKGELGVKDKGGSSTSSGTYVADAQTEADRRVECMALRVFRELAPGVRVVAEESSEDEISPTDYERDLNSKEKMMTLAFARDAFVGENDEMWAPALRKPIASDRVTVYFDPLDGTNEYASGEREAITILCGIAVDGVPVAGVVGQPFYNYRAEASAGARLERVVWGGLGAGVFGLDVAANASRPALPPNGPHVVAVNRNTRENRQEPVLEALRSRVDVRISATGYHYLLLLERRAHSALMLRKASKKWDTCAGEALLRATGGVVTDTVGRRYNYAYNVNALPNLSGMTASLDAALHCEMTTIIRDVIAPLGEYPYDVDDPSIKVGILDQTRTPEGGWRAVTVDVGGCLIEPSERVADVYARVAADLGANHVTPVSASKDFKDAFAKYRGRDEPGAMRYYGDGKTFWRKVVRHVLAGGAETSGFVSDATVEAMLSALYDYYESPSSWYVAQGALEAFDRLRKAGIKVALASNWDSRLPKLLDALGVTPHVDAIVVSAIQGYEKPSREFFAAVSRDVGVAPSATLHVGDDAVNDVAGASAASFAAAVLWAPLPLDVSLRASDFHELADALIVANLRERRARGVAMGDENERVFF